MKRETKRGPVIGLERSPYTNGHIPNQEGIYLVRGVWGDLQPQQIEVYRHPIKGLCCFSEDFGSGGSGVNDETDCHVSVQFTGLEFLSKVGELK